MVQGALTNDEVTREQTSNQQQEDKLLNQILNNTELLLDAPFREQLLEKDLGAPFSEQLFKKRLLSYLPQPRINQ